MSSPLPSVSEEGRHMLCQGSQRYLEEAVAAPLLQSQQRYLHLHRLWSLSLLVVNSAHMINMRISLAWFWLRNELSRMPFKVQDPVGGKERHAFVLMQQRSF